MKNLKSQFLRVFVVQLFFTFNASAQYKIEVLDSNTFHLDEGVILSKTSFRGLSVVDDKTIWISGSRGTIAKSVDGGKTFLFQQLKGYEKSDFRDIEAFDDKRAIMMSSGTPAYILKTIDGGQTWKEVYKNTDTAYFLDAMDFWNDKKGMLVGDPINGHFLLLQTNDGGETWQQLDASKTPKAKLGEAVFAASGTSFRCDKEFPLCSFVTGGKVSRFIQIVMEEEFVGSAQKLPIMQGRSTQGAFSFAYLGSIFVAVGGDFLQDTLSYQSSCKGYFEPTILPLLGDIDFKIKQYFPNGYRSCVEIVDDKIMVSCGNRGIDIGTIMWKNISKESFHVVRKAKKGKAVFLAGGKGKIGKLIY